MIGAVVARRAHNPEAPGSSPGSWAKSSVLRGWGIFLYLDTPLDVDVSEIYVCLLPVIELILDFLPVIGLNGKGVMTIF